MAVIKVNEEAFNETVKEGFWIADFYTDHCGPCKMLDIIINDIIFDNPEVNLVKCNIEDSPAYAERFEIHGTPTLLYLVDGEIRERSEGALPREMVEEYISKAMYGE